MKKQIVLSGLFASLAILSASSARAFTSVKTTTVTATVTTGGVSIVHYDHFLRHVDLVSPDPTDIVWKDAVGGGSWKIAETMIQLNWTVTNGNGGIQIYTDNMAPNANPATNPVFLDPSPGAINEYNAHNLDSNPSGLLKVQPGGVLQSSSRLPVAWSIKGNPQTVGTTLKPADPNTGDLAGAAGRFQWLFMLDKKTPAIDLNGIDSDNNGIAWDDPTTPTQAGDGEAFSNGIPYVTMIKTAGIHEFSGPGQFNEDSDHTSFVYLEANFSTASSGDVYKTNKMVIEAFIQ